MSTWRAVEEGIVESLAGLNWGGSPLLATVAGRTALDRKSTTAAILRERPPAAHVIVDGRGTAERATGRPGRPVIRVLVAARSYRGDTDTRRGGVDSPGLFEVIERTAGILHNMAIAPDYQLSLANEEALPGADGTALWEQVYEVRRPAESAAPTFGGTALAGDGARVCVEPGVLQTAAARFSFPGIDGVFERRLGVRERPIWWRGELRANDEAELNAIESAIEDELYEGQSKVLDAGGRQHENCVARAYRRNGPRGRDELTGQIVQDFELEFTQLGG